MANRFVSPQQQFINFAGQPYAGGKLFFFISGTSTPTPTYQDEGLTTPNTNPVILDSAGDAGNIFLDPGITYKVTLTDSSNNPIWTFDPVIPIDSDTGSGFEPIVSCNASGTNAITLTPITASQQPNAYSNYQIFAFVPSSTTTGSVSLQVGTLPFESVFVAPGIQAGAQTFVAGDGPYYVAYGSLVGGSGPGFLLLNQNLGGIQSQLPVQAPQGYLTLTSQTPVIQTDVVGGTNLFYTPLFGLGAPIHNGSSIVSTILPGELSLALTTAQVANNIYDVYLAFNGGSPVIGTGPSWSAGTGGSITAGSCARGTGTGGAALVRTQGFWTNAAAISLTYNLGGGNVVLSVPANQGIFLGSIFIDSTAGQVSAYRSWGQSRKFGVSNAFNRQQIYLQAGDNTSSWLAAVAASFSPSNGNAANSLTVFSCLPEEEYDLKFFQDVLLSTTTTSSTTLAIGIGVNSTTVATGLNGTGSLNNSTSSNTSLMLTAATPLAPSLGINVITCLQRSPSNNGTAAYNGTISSMLLSAQYRG